MSAHPERYGTWRTVKLWLRALGESLAEAWRSKWFVIVALIAGWLVWILSSVTWRVVGEPVPDTAGRLAQMQTLIAMFQAAVTTVAVLAAVHSNRTSLTIARDARTREDRALRNERVGRVNDLVGSSLEAAGQAGVLATFQDLGLHSWRRWLPESPAQRDLAVAAWKAFVEAVARASKAVERIRYDDPDLITPAENLFDVVLKMQVVATEGEVARLMDLAREVRSHANQLQSLVNGQEPSSKPSG